jgi:RND family efflux transporter MFP subunit
MSLVKQILLSLIVVVVAAGGWFAFQNRALLLGESDAATPNRPSGPGASAQGAGAQGGASRGGQGGFGGMSTPPVVTASVETDASGADVRSIGTVAARQEVTIFPQVTGFVTEVAFTPGTEVAKGDVLVRLDNADQMVAVERAKIALDTARQARERGDKLSKTNNITTAAWDELVATERAAEVDLKSAELELAKRTLIAPFAGMVGLSDVSVGDLVNSQKAITTLADTSTVTVGFEVPERVSGQLARGQEVKATSEGSAGVAITGAVTAIDNRVDPEARTLRAEASLSNEADALKPGMSVIVSLSFAGTPHPSVPSLAVQWDRDGAYVWKLDGDVVHRTSVQVVARRSGAVTVVGDLADGDQVVVEGVLRLREGMKVARVGDDSGKPAAEPSAPPAATSGTATATVPKS